MKPSRTIHKSIRIPEKMYRYIEEFEGTTWNDKINNLLDYYMFRDNEYRKYLKELESQIAEKKQLLEEFQNKISKFQDLLK